MSFQDLGNLGDFLGGIVVIVSLFYLAFQVRQNTQSLHTESYARALERLAAMQSRLGADAELASLLNRGMSNARSLGTEERIQFSWIFYEMFGAFEFMFDQARKGALDDEVWKRWAATMSWWLSFPGVQSWWRSRPTPFSTSFASFVDSIPTSHPLDAAAAERFQAFLQGDGA